MEEDEVKTPQSNVSDIGSLNAINNSSINFFEQKEVFATLQNTITEAVADALAKLT